MPLDILNVFLTYRESLLIRLTNLILIKYHLYYYSHKYHFLQSVSKFYIIHRKQSFKTKKTVQTI